jgi:hypothetical protein
MMMFRRCRHSVGAASADGIDSAFIAQRSKAAERHPVVSVTVFAIGLLGVGLFLTSLIRALAYNNTRAPGDTSRLGLAGGSIIFGILGVILAGIGAIGLRIHSIKRWYRSQLPRPRA